MTCCCVPATTTPSSSAARRTSTFISGARTTTWAGSPPFGATAMTSGKGLKVGCSVAIRATSQSQIYWWRVVGVNIGLHWLHSWFTPVGNAHLTRCANGSPWSSLIFNVEFLWFNSSLLDLFINILLSLLIVLTRKLDSLIGTVSPVLLFLLIVELELF